MEMVFSSALLWKCTVCTSRPFICGNSTILWPGLPCSRKSNSLPGWAMVELFWVTGGFLHLAAGGFFMGGLRWQRNTHHGDTEARRKPGTNYNRGRRGTQRKTLPLIYADER